MIDFRVDRRSGVPVYRQLVDQVRRAVQLGVLRPGDQLPTVREVVGRTPVNPNTVHRAYQELERLGLTAARPGVGTFVTARAEALPAGRRDAVLAQLVRVLGDARRAGFEEAALRAAVDEALDRTRGDGRR